MKSSLKWIVFGLVTVTATSILFWQSDLTKIGLTKQLCQMNISEREHQASETHHIGIGIDFGTGYNHSMQENLEQSQAKSNHVLLGHIDLSHTYYQDEPDYWRPTFRGWGANKGGSSTNVSTAANLNSNMDNSTHWCLLSHESLKGVYGNIKWFDHFPHACETLLPCWSWFRRRHAVDRCGFALLNGLQLDRLNPNNTWQYQLVNKMGCQIRYTDPRNDNVSHTPIVYSPPYRRLRPRFGDGRVYLDKTSDAHALRRLVIPDTIIEEAKGKDMRSDNLPPPLQVGFLQRNGNSRVITNADEIVEGLRLALPNNTNVTIDYFNYARIEDQASFWATKHVIITAHGAAVANAVLITDETTVLQLHPGDFYWPSMEPLVEQSGGIALSWSMNENPIKSHGMLIQNPNKKNKHQFANITAPVNEIVELVLSSVYYDIPRQQWRARQ